MESLSSLEGVDLNPNTHSPIYAVRAPFMEHWDTHPDKTPHSGFVYYLTITMVVLVSLVAMMNETVCRCLALLTILAPDSVGTARLAFHGF